MIYRNPLTGETNVFDNNPPHDWVHVAGRTRIETMGTETLYRNLLTKELQLFPTFEQPEGWAHVAEAKI